VGQIPRAIGITPDGSRAYVPNRGSNTVSVIDLSTNQVVGQPIAVGVLPTGIAISPDGSRAYVANASAGASSVSVIAIPADTVVKTIPLANNAAPQYIAITPNQAPSASFRSGQAVADSPTSFDATPSSDSDGTVAGYTWDFGDGSPAVAGGATPTHTYAAPGTYTVRLTVTDNEGCSTQFVYTGQTASCNGKPAASTSSQVSVAAAPSDVTPPQATIAKLKKKYAATRVRIRFSSSETGSTFTCKLDKEPAKACTSPVVYKHLEPGKHKFALVATDAAGNVAAPVNAKFKVVPKHG
jgi:YVTN family beta-propeller protein